MKCYEITFSPTGGTKETADLLCRDLAEQSMAIDLCDRHGDFMQCPVWGDRPHLDESGQKAAYQLCAVYFRLSHGCKEAGCVVTSLGDVALSVLRANRRECELFL